MEKPYGIREGVLDEHALRVAVRSFCGVARRSLVRGMVGSSWPRSRALQSPPRSGRACISGALQGDPGGARQLLEGIGTLRGAQSGAGETGAASGRVAVEQLCHDGRQGGVAGMAIDRLA